VCVCVCVRVHTHARTHTHTPHTHAHTHAHTAELKHIPCEVGSDSLVSGGGGSDGGVVTFWGRGGVVRRTCSFASNSIFSFSCSNRHIERGCQTRKRITSASIRQHASAYVSIRQHASAYVSIRQHASAYVAYVSIRQHLERGCQTRRRRTSASIVTIYTHTLSLTHTPAKLASEGRGRAQTQ
jgi:hypothetical protein